MNRAAIWVLALWFVVGGCEKPCKPGFQRYGVKCVMSPVYDSGVDPDGAGEQSNLDAAIEGVDPNGPLDASREPAQDSGKTPGANEAGSDTLEGGAPVFCAQADCDPAADCKEEVGGAICTCRDGYVDALGNGKKCTDVDECAASDTCDKNADCDNHPGTFTCTCKKGFNGDGVTACEANVVCADALGSNCASKASCQAVKGINYCVCASGYAGDGATCTDIDECKVNHGGCGDEAFNTCANQPGGPPVCADIDECLVGNGGCDSLVSCGNVSPGRTCGACPSGYTGKGDTGCLPGLTGLLLSTGTLSPAFNTAITSYSVVLPISTQTISLTPSAPFGIAIAVLSNTVTSGQAWTSSTLNLNDNIITIVVSQSGRPSQTYRVTVTRGKQQAFVKASNAEASDLFGASVAISGETMVIGAPGEDSSGVETSNGAAGSGAAYVFSRSGGTWSQRAYLKASNAAEGDGFGKSVAIYGGFIVVGAPGEDSNAKGLGGSQSNNSASGSGAAYVFAVGTNGWTQTEYLKASTTAAGDGFGTSVAIDRSTIVVGATGGLAAFVFTYNGVSWSQPTKVIAASVAGDGFGCSVSISGDTLAIGASGESTTANSSGAAYVFVRNGASWSQQAKLKSANAHSIALFGYNVSVSGDTLAVGEVGEASSAVGINGSPQDDDQASYSGAVHIYVRNSSNVWSKQAHIKANNAEGGDGFGCSASLSDSLLVVGSLVEEGASAGLGGDYTNNAAFGTGAAYLFSRTGTTWTQKAYVKSSNPGADDQFGYAVAISGDTFVVGAHQEDSSTSGINGVSNEAASSSGAAYVFR